MPTNFDNLLRKRKFAKAFTSAQKIVKADDTSKLGEAHVALGRIFFEFEQYSDAAFHLDQAIAGRAELFSARWHKSEALQWLHALHVWANHRITSSAKQQLELTGETELWWKYQTGAEEPPDYDPLASWEVRIAGCRLHRRRCREQPHNLEVGSSARTYVGRLFADGKTKRTPTIGSLALPLLRVKYSISVQVCCSI